MEELFFVHTCGTDVWFTFNKMAGDIVLAERSEHVDVRCIRDDVWYSISVGEHVPASFRTAGCSRW